MEFTKPTQNLADFLRRKIYRNHVKFGVWRYRDKPATGDFNTEFTTPTDLVVWTTVAKDEEEEKKTLWLGTMIGTPRKGWWEQYGPMLELGPLENQRLVFWATLRAGPASIPMLSVAMGVMPEIWTPSNSLKVYSLEERDPEKRKRMSPSELVANTLSQKQFSYYGEVGLHSIIAAQHGLVDMKEGTV